MWGLAGYMVVWKGSMEGMDSKCCCHLGGLEPLDLALILPNFHILRLAPLSLHRDLLLHEGEGFEPMAAGTVLESLEHFDMIHLNAA